MKQAIENATRVGKATVTTGMASTGLLLLLNGVARQAQEDAAIDAEDILTQAEEANALDPIG